MSELIIVEFEGAAGDPSTKLGMTKKVRLIGQDDSDTDSDPDFFQGQGLLIRVDSCAFPPEAGRRG